MSDREFQGLDLPPEVQRDLGAEFEIGQSPVDHGADVVLLDDYRDSTTPQSAEKIMGGFIHAVCTAFEIWPAANLRVLQDLMREAEQLGLSRAHTLGAIRAAIQITNMREEEGGG